MITAYNILGDGAFWRTNKVLTRHIGDFLASSFLSFLIDKEEYHRKNNTLVSDEGEVWFYATANKIESETCLSYRQQKTAIKVLVEAGLLQTKVMGLPAKVHFSIEHNKIVQIVTTSISESAILVDPKAQNNNKNILSKNKEVRERPTPATAALPPSDADSFIARHSAPVSDPDHFGTVGLTAFEGGTENDYESVYGRIAEHLNGSADWKAIAGLAKCTMSGEQFKEELQAWIRHFINKPHLYKKPIQSLRGGPISFINWLRKPWAQDKYNPATKAKQIQSLRGGPVRRTITTA